jgi:parvulin-like peptidyl-prolyl isomerase
MTITNKTKLFVSALSALLLTGALIPSKASAKVVGNTVATVNGEPVLESEFKRNLDSIIAQYGHNMPDALKDEKSKKALEDKVLNQMIDYVLLHQQANKIGIKAREHEINEQLTQMKEPLTFDEKGKKVSPKEVDRLFDEELKKEGITLEELKQEITKRILIRKYIQQEISAKIKPADDKEVRALFEKIKRLVDGDKSILKSMSESESQEITQIAQKLEELVAERVRVRHIFFKTDNSMSASEREKILEKAKRVKREFDKGADFGDLAKKYSDDKQSADREGDIGYVIASMPFPKSFLDTAFSLRVGETSNPVATPVGYHIIRIEEKRAKQKLRYEDVKEDLTQYLSEKDFQAKLMEEVKELRKKASIKISKS